MLKTILFVLQIAIPMLLIACILVQQKGTALGSSFGGEAGGFYIKKRGLEKKIFLAAIIFSALFIVIALLNLLLIK